jgi:hypothetical protein
MAESGNVDIKARLVLDDAASKSVELVRGGFERLDHSVEHVQHTVGAFVKTAASMALGFQFDHGIESLKEWGHEAMEAAKAAGEQTKEIAGMLAAQDQSGKSFDELRKDAKEYREKLEEMGIQAGVSSAATVDAFTDIAARSSKPTEEVVKMTEQMMYAGKVVPGGLGAITDGYRMMEMGMIRAKNPLVMLIAQSHLMKGTAKEVASQLQKMAPEQAMKLADAAIGKMAERGKAMPLKGGAMIQSIKDMAEQSMVGAGEALLKALSKPYALVREIFMENRGDLSNLYKAAGEGLGEAISWGVGQAKEGIDYVKTHSDEIKKDIKEGWDYAKKVFEFLLAHRKELMVGFAISKAAPLAASAAGALPGMASGAFNLASGAIGALPNAIMGFVDASKSGVSATQQLSMGLGKLRTTMNSAVSANVAMAAAMAATYLAYDQFNKLLAENRMLVQSLGSAIGSMLGTMKYKTMDTLENEAAARESLERQNRKMEEQTNDHRIRLLAQQSAALYELDPSGGQGTQGLVNAFNDAANASDEGAEKYAASLILNSGLTVDYLKKAGFGLAGGLEEFMRIVGEGADPSKLKRFLGEYDPKKMKVDQHVDFRGSKFEIHQDFRNEDPDRIALVFRRDILRAAEHRRVSRTSSF